MAGDGEGGGRSGPPVNTIIILLSLLLVIAIAVIAWLMLFREASVPDRRGNASAMAAIGSPGDAGAETVGGAGQGVDPQAYGWLIGDWGYANCSTLVHITRAPGGIALATGSGQPARERIVSASATEVVTDAARYIRDADEVRWMSGNIEITRLVPCRQGAETP